MVIAFVLACSRAPLAPTATAVPTPTSTPLPTIIDVPRVSSSFINLEDLNETISEVPRIAWEDSQARLTENGTASQGAVELEIIVGPSTNLYFSENEAAFKTAIQFWANFDQPSRYIASFYYFDDLVWAEDELIELGYSEQSASATVRGPCTVALAQIPG